MLIFCATKAAMERRGEEMEKAGVGLPFFLRTGADIPQALRALEADRTVIANASTVATGWRIPEGVRVVLDPDLAEEGREALRAQCEARVHRAAEQVRVQLHIPGSETDSRIAETLSVKNPFLQLRFEPGAEPV